MIVFIFFIIMIYNIVLVFVSSLDHFDSPFPYKAYIITTESMQPVLNKNDVIIIDKPNSKKLAKGDIITYIENGEIITHRIIEVKAETSEYLTKGDNNREEDKYLVKYENIIGKKVFKIPYIGNIINSLKNAIIIILIVLIFLVVLLFKIEQDEKRRRRRMKKKNEDKKRENLNSNN